MNASPPSVLPRRVRVAILGAGMSGICMGAQLRRRGIEDFVIVEKASAVGGTWRENTYPGVACDVPSHLYSFSFAPNPDWQHAFSGGGEIRDYLEHCVDRHGLRDRLHLNREVTAATFEGGRWRITTRDGSEVEAEVVVSGLGGLHVPKHPEIEGLDTFRGPRFHTARWDHECDLTAKRVAVIGTGASAAQVVPAIAERTAHLTVFQRSAAWVFPRMARGITPERRERYRRHPWLMRSHRWLLWLLLDVVGTVGLRRGSFINRRMERRALEFLERSVPDPETRRKLTPDYEVGCKRRVISDDYLAAFARDDVSLVTEPIERVEPQGVRDATGRLHPADVIVEATGFRPFDIHEYVDIRGRDGRSLRDVWTKRVESYRTSMVPGFPNFFMLLGPNSATGHTSALIMIESQARWVVRTLGLLERYQARWVEPAPEATRRFNRRLQRDMKRMVFSGGCGAWYTDADDFNYTLWPYSAARYVLQTLRPKRRELRID